jgi:hypothetical protein
MQYRSKLLVVATGALGLAVVGVAALWWWTHSATAGKFWSHNAATVLQYAVPPVLALIGWTAQRLISPRSARSTPEQLTQAQQALAHRGLDWWRGVPEPAWPGRPLRAGLSPLNVQWVRRTPGDRAAVQGPAGTDLAGLTAWLRGGGNCRLVIRGEASSGKSVFARLLMANLLSSRDQEEPVPVFLPLWSWNPDQQGLHDWLKARIAKAYPELGETAVYGPTAVADLVDQGRVLPILDGLDALPEACRNAVLADGEFISQARVIVTGRTDVFSNVEDFVVIEPSAVDQPESARFIREVTRYEDVIQELGRVFNDDNASDLTTIMSEPRMIYLASIVYGTVPGNAVQKADATAGLYDRVEAYLLGNLVPALLPAGDRWCATFPWYAPGAQRWLRFLAQLDLRDPGGRRVLGDRVDRTADLADLDDPGTSRIAWWNLHRGVPFLRRRQALLRALFAGMIVFGADVCIYKFHHVARPHKTGWPYSLLTAGAYGLVIFVACVFLGDARATAGERPFAAATRFAASRWAIGYFWTRWWRVVMAAIIGFCCFGTLIGIRVAVGYKSPSTGFRTGIYDAITQGALIVVITFLLAGVPAAPRTVRAVDFGRPGWSARRAFASAVVIGVLFGVLWGVGAVLKHQNPPYQGYGTTIPTGLITGVDFALGAWLFRWSRGWFTSANAANPRTAARMDLAAALLRPFILAVTFAFAFGISAPFHFADYNVLAWFVAGLVLGNLESEWPLYVTAIAFLAIRRKSLPLRLMRFLECCRAAGILRVVGQEYQIHDVGLLRWLRSHRIRQVLAEELAGVEGIESAYLYGSWEVGQAGQAGAAAPGGGLRVLLIGQPDDQALDDARRRAADRVSGDVDFAVRPAAWWRDGADAVHAAVARSPLAPIPMGDRSRGPVLTRRS